MRQRLFVFFLYTLVYSIEEVIFLEKRTVSLEEYNLSYYDEDENKVTQVESEYIQTPRICNHCRQTGEQLAVGGVLLYGEEDLADGIIFTACQHCRNTSMHYIKHITSTNGGGYYEVDKSFPNVREATSDVPEYVVKNFPDFMKIYEQAQEAEKKDLDQLAGMGYRKAIEFLITDYLIKHPVDGAEKEWLENPKTSLSAKINKLDNARIKKIAKAISYLGNDETHYSRRHPEYGIDKLKAFIRVFLSDLENDLIYKEVEQLIEKK